MSEQQKPAVVERKTVIDGEELVTLPMQKGIELFHNKDADTPVIFAVLNNEVMFKKLIKK